jgi:hypothetical protein
MEMEGKKGECTFAEENPLANLADHGELKIWELDNHLKTSCTVVEQGRYLILKFHIPAIELRQHQTRRAYDYPFTYPIATDPAHSPDCIPQIDSALTQ